MTEAPTLNLRIESDGLSFNTHVYDQYGREVKNIVSIDWRVDSRGMAKCVIGIENVPFRFTRPAECEIVVVETPASVYLRGLKEQQAEDVAALKPPPGVGE